MLLYEKLFRFTSDVTLMELSNFNIKLLRQLSEEAPGTFQHSIQVSNLAAAAANEYKINSAQANKIYTYVMDHTEYDYMSVEFTVDYEKFCKFFAVLRDTKE
jgi:HD-GYP domain-containing protein (c-di-GMP phosphodiesterase class II)